MTECKGICKQRGYSVVMPRNGYEKNVWCTTCVAKIPKEDIIYTENINDQRPRCPCCRKLVRQGSFTGAYNMPTNFVNVR